MSPASVSVRWSLDELPLPVRGRGAVRAARRALRWYTPRNNLKRPPESRSTSTNPTPTTRNPARRGTLPTKARPPREPSPWAAARSPTRPRPACWSFTRKTPWNDDPAAPGDHGDSGIRMLPEASMSYVAYFQGDHENPQRPITFLFNGGPGSSTVWLHMGAFWPQARSDPDDSHSPAAPYVGRQRLQPARCQRPGVHRRAGHGLQPHRAASRQGEGVLRRRCDAHAFAEFIVAVPLAVRPLELAEVPVRRELRHDRARRCWRTCCRTRQPSTSTA